MKKNSDYTCQLRVREYSKKPTTWETDDYIGHAVNESIQANTTNPTASFTTSATTEWLVVGFYTNTSGGLVMSEF